MKKLLITIVIVLLVCIGVVWLYLARNAQDLLKESLLNITHNKATFNSIRYQFPLNFIVDDLKFQTLMNPDKEMSISVQELQVLVNWQSVIRDKVLNISDLVMRDVVVTGRVLKQRDEDVVEKKEIVETNNGVDSTKSKLSTYMAVFIDHCQVVNASIKIENERMPIQLSGVVLNVSDLKLPLQNIDTSFDLSGELMDLGGYLKGIPFDGKGEINWLARNLNAGIRLYYNEHKNYLLANLISEANNLLITGNLKDAFRLLVDYNQLPAMDSVVTSGINSLNMDVNGEFQIETKLDHVQFERVNFSGNGEIKN